jgi:putative ABC transport system permease protein
MNYIRQTRLSLRQLFRQKLFASINLVSFTTGICIALMVGQYVWFEFSFEDFNDNADEVYRVNLYNTENGVFTEISSGTVSGLAYEMKATMPGVYAIARISKTGGIAVNKIKDISDVEASMIYADSDIVDLLALKLLYKGNAILKEGTKSLLISNSTALKYFGKTDVVGATLDLGFNNNTVATVPYQIEGVFQDIPENSNEHFDFVLPIENPGDWDKNWDWSNAITYVRFEKDVKHETINAAFSKIVKAHHHDDKGDRYLLEPISDIRLRALNGRGTYSTARTFILFGIIILVLAWCNYVNLSTAGFVDRIKDTGVRKLLGASRLQLVKTMLFDTFMFNVIAFAIAAIVFVVSWHWVGEFIQSSTKVTIFMHTTPALVCLSFVIFSSLVSGLYPSIFLSSFKPLQSLKGKVTSFVDRPTFRRILVVVQLTVSIILITAIFAVNGQLGFMKGQDLGIAIDQTMIVSGAIMSNNSSVDRYQPFQTEVLKLPGVKAITFASSYPGSEIDWHRTDITLGESKDFLYDSRIVAIGTEFLEMFSIPLLAGHNFNPDVLYDSKSLLLNEEACKMFKFFPYEKALGQSISIGSRTFKVVGVVKNYHFRSLQYPLQPVLFMHGYPRAPTYAIKFDARTLSSLLPKLATTWDTFYAGNIFKFEFLEDTFNKQYRSEELVGRVVGLLTFFGMLISCSGLFGLSLYSVNQRLKEIGIRKILGASEGNIVFFLWTEYMLLIIIGSVASITIGYFLVERWLNNYAYKMPITTLLFIIPILAVTAFTIMTISIRTIAAAKQNPANILKHE